MKKLLLLLLFIPALLNAQEDTTGLATAATDTTISPQQKPIESRQKRFDIGGGVQVNSFGYMGTSAGPMFTARANSKYGRIAGVLNVSYNLNNKYEYYFPYWSNNYPDFLISDIRYNFIKVSLAMQVPFFNRTNKKGFSMSGILGISYCNGLGSGEIKSGFDKPSAPSADSLETYYGVGNPIYSQDFTMEKYNMEAVSIDIGFSFAYTPPYSHCQIFADALILPTVNINNKYEGTIDKNYWNDARASNINPYSFCINIGLRYLPYNAWQTKPPKRRNK